MILASILVPFRNPSFYRSGRQLSLRSCISDGFWHNCRLADAVFQTICPRRSLLIFSWFWQKGSTLYISVRSRTPEASPLEPIKMINNLRRTIKIGNNPRRTIKISNNPRRNNTKKQQSPPHTTAYPSTAAPRRRRGTAVGR